MKISNIGCHNEVPNFSCLPPLKFISCFSESIKATPGLQAAFLNGPSGKSGFSHRVALCSSRDPLSPDQPVGGLLRDGLESCLWHVCCDWTGSRAHQVCSLFIGWVLGTGHKGWQREMCCVPRQKEKRSWFSLRTQLAVFIAVTKKSPPP